MKFALIGAGGHAKAIVEALTASGHEVAAYVDARQSDWLDAKRIPDDRSFTDTRLPIVIGFGGTTPRALASRLHVLRAYLDRGFRAPIVLHPASSVSPSARIAEGAVVIAGAVIQPAAVIGLGAIVNTNAVVDHDSVVAEGAHIAPGAVVLGGCSIGSCAIVGAGAVVLQGTTVPNRTLVRATTLWRGRISGKRRK